jgi:hypothetical protein
MFNKNLEVLFLAVVFALANGCAYAAGGFTHMYIAKKSFDAIKDPQIKKTIQENLGAYYLGAHFPDVGYISNNLKDYKELLLIIGKPEAMAISGKNYGEITHWDKFLDEYKNVLSGKYKHPITDNPAAFAFILGVATHRVSDDIWHTERDDLLDDAVKGVKVCGEINSTSKCLFEGEPPYADWKIQPNADWKFKTCDKSRSRFCYYGFILKLRDLDALAWTDKIKDAHWAADVGIDYAVYTDHRIDLDVPRALGSVDSASDSALDIAVETLRNLDAKTVLCLDKKDNTKKPCNPIRQTQGGFDVPTKQDILRDFFVYKSFAVDGIVKQSKDKNDLGVPAIGVLRTYGFYSKLHLMDWAFANYETDPDVGLNAIAVHVTNCISALGAMLKDDAGSQKMFRFCEENPKR